MASQKLDIVAWTRDKMLKTARKHLLTASQAADGALPEPNEKWSPRHKKVWADAQKATHEAPIYLKDALDFHTALFRADQNREAPRPLAIAFIPVLPLDQWKAQAALVDEATEQERKAITAVVVEPEKKS